MGATLRPLRRFEKRRLRVSIPQTVCGAKSVTVFTWRPLHPLHRQRLSIAKDCPPPNTHFGRHFDERNNQTKSNRIQSNRIKSNQIETAPLNCNQLSSSILGPKAVGRHTWNCVREASRDTQQRQTQTGGHCSARPLVHECAPLPHRLDLTDHWS